MSQFVCESTKLAPADVFQRVTLKPGDRIRFLVSMPEDDIRMGERGTVHSINYGDDTTIVITKDGWVGALIFLDTELWKLEVLP